MISARTKLFGVIGDPIGHSLSPILQNWLLDKIDLDGRYVAFHVIPQNLSKALHGMRSLGIRGLNVTVPHKEKVLQYLDDISLEAKLLGSVNTILNDDGKLRGFNTDVPGFIQSVGSLQFNFANARAIILGAGGAAKAVGFALKKLGVTELVICDLSMELTRQLAQKCVSEFGFKTVKEISTTDDSLEDEVAKSSVLINATPVGMAPDFDRSPLMDTGGLHRDMLVYDLIYNPVKTKLLLDAEKAGATIKNGLDMLILQGVASMEIWSERRIQLGGASINEIRIQMLNAMKKDE